MANTSDTNKETLVNLEGLSIFKSYADKYYMSASDTPIMSTQVCDCVGNTGTYDTSTEIAEINGIKYHITGDATCEIVGFNSDNSNGNLTLGFIVVYGKYYAVTEITNDGATEFNNDETILTLNIVNKIKLGSGSTGTRTTGCFIFCSSLTSVTINAPVTIGSYFLYSCSSLTSVTINAPVTIGSYFLYSCSSLTSVTINAPVTCSGFFLSDCSSLTSVTINSDLICDSTGYAKFYDCTNLRAIYIGTYGSIKIASNSSNFRNCTELTDIYYIGTEEQCQENVDIEDGSQGNLANVTWHYKWTPGGDGEDSSNTGGITDGLEDVNIEIEGKDWKALSWYDLIKVTKVTSEENPYDPDDPKYPNWQPTITPQNPKFILDFTDMWTAIYEDCANGNTDEHPQTVTAASMLYSVRYHWHLKLNFTFGNIDIFFDTFETGTNLTTEDIYSTLSGVSYKGLESSEGNINGTITAPSNLCAGNPILATGYITIVDGSNTVTCPVVAIGLKDDELNIQYLGASVIETYNIDATPNLNYSTVYIEVIETELTTQM